jgi:hypothetical protein
MIDGNQLDLVQIGHLGQLLGQPARIVAVARHERRTRDLDVLVVVHREEAAVAGGAIRN